ncbi:MAG: cation diffusion facilitator family transporter [Bacillota bacterium]|nr:cation diffusion facilitator family transporter [Bacillota bacterium]
MQNRDKVIVRTSIVGILMNVLLAAFKAGVGILSNSIAVILDAVNNLSDALSSVITIVGTKLASKAPDKKHPLGYGRIEYLSAMIVSALVLYAGLTSIVESVKKIIHPEEADYSTTALIIISVAIVVKLLLGWYVKHKGEQVNSGALVASGKDASFDAILSASVLASAIIFITTGISLEAYVGVIISLFIIKAGVEMMLETLNDIIGKRTDAELARKIKALLTEEPEVRGAYDLYLSNYGPEKDIGSVHLELPETMTVAEVDVLTNKLVRKVYKETGIILTGISVYSYNTEDGNAVKLREEIEQIVLAHEWALQVHGFYVEEESKSIRFDVVMSFDIEKAEGLKILYDELSEAYGEYTFSIQPDVDITDL